MKINQGIVVCIDSPSDLASLASSACAFVGLQVLDFASGDHGILEILHHGMHGLEPVARVMSSRFREEDSIFLRQAIL
jgi:hypothetical protein